MWIIVDNVDKYKEWFFVGNGVIPDGVRKTGIVSNLPDEFRNIVSAGRNPHIRWT